MQALFEYGFQRASQGVAFEAVSTASVEPRGKPSP
jgi:hypothetical protein